MMCQISVIVPVYNVEKYLNRCVDSILAQTFTDFELILVDDGSPDRCGKICDEYAAKDGRIKVVHQKNAGVSAARNAGLQIAKGDYVTFVDSDDYCGKDFLQELVDVSKSTGADWVQSGYKICNDCGEMKSVCQRKVGLWSIKSEEDRICFLTHNIVYHSLGWEVWTALFRTEIIKTNRIQFCETCENFAEDLGFTLGYILCCNKVVSIEACNYCYVQHEGSMMANSKNVAKLDSVNEIAIHFGEQFFDTVHNRKNRKRYALIYYLIMRNQYSKLNFYGEACKEVLFIDKQIKNIKWHDRWISKLVYHRKELSDILGVREASIAILNSRLLYHRNWKLYEVESAVAWKFLIK